MANEARPFQKIPIAHKRIKLREQNQAEAARIKSAHKTSPVMARVLAARGYRADTELANFIRPSLKEGLPHPDKLKGLREAVALISEVARRGDPVAICCDFDVDGLSGGAQLAHFLETVGVSHRVFVPDRFEDGYGLNERMVAQIAKEGFKLLITIDFGTTNLREIAVARSLGLATVVVDHHHVEEIPPADVFINPNQQGCGFGEKILSAAGLTWYLLLALSSAFSEKRAVDIKSYLDLACLGTICDMVPLRGVNRVIAKRGLELLATSTRPGLVALKEVVGIHRAPTCTDVSFGIGPRLNAAGRMVHGDAVIELLTTSSSDRAKRIAQRLNKLNLERQETEVRVKDLAVQALGTHTSLPWGIVVADKEFHTGVVGIVAQRLVESFYRPAVVLGIDNQGLFKGSVRGIRGFSVVEALSAVSRHVIKFGGHEGAGGLTLKASQLESFTGAFVEVCKKRLASLEVDPYVEADTEISLKDMEIELVHEFQRLAPFGMGNPNPVLLTKGLKVLQIKVLKNTHLKATLTDGERFLSGLMWRHTSHPALVQGSIVNVAFRPDCNNFNGITELQGNIQAIEAA